MNQSTRTPNHPATGTPTGASVLPEDGLLRRKLMSWNILRKAITGLLGLVLAAAPAIAAPTITEFMAANSATLADEDGAFSDWIEIFNPDRDPVNLAGWYLTDAATIKTKWQFPNVTVPGGGYLVVFASGKNRRDPGRTLHTNFSLSAGGEYLGLIRPDGTTVATDFAPTFPAQYSDISFGITQPTDGSAGAIGYLRTATPGANNGGANALTLVEKVTFSRPATTFSESFLLELSGASAGQHIHYVIAAPSANGAAIPSPTRSSPRYFRPITIDSSVIVRAAVFSDDDTVQGLDSTTQFVKLGANLTASAAQLPVLVLDDHGLGELNKDGLDHPAWLYTFGARGPGNTAFTAGPGLATPITMTVRGSSSATFPKKSYNLELTDSSGKKTPQSLFGSAPADKWALVGPWFFDRALIKNAFVYELSRRLGHWAPNVQLVEVFFNSAGGELSDASYAGIYALTDRIEIGANRVNITPLTSADNAAPEITGGYILKFDAPAADEYSWITRNGFPNNGTSAVIVASQKAVDLSTPQRDYIRDYVQQLEDALFADADQGFSSRTYLDFIDRASWVDYHLLNTFVSNFDALDRSSYFTKDRGGKLVAGPVWDFDRSLGSATVFHTTPWDVWNTEDATDFWNTGWWARLVRDPEFMQDWIDRWQSLRRDTFSTGNLLNLADQLSASIGPAAAARDAARWPDDPRFPQGTSGGVSEMKNWLTQRARWIDQKFLAAPTANDNGTAITFTPPAGAQLIYTLDGSDPRLLGGDIAPNAAVSSAPLTVASTTNVHVRSYRADLRNTFPGSPWSSAVGSAASSPLAPASKLINFSSRGLIGVGGQALITGVSVRDTVNKNYVVRAVGPTLASFGAAGALPDPVIGVFTANQVEIYRNSSWQNGLDGAKLPALFQTVGAFPLTTGSHDAALVAQTSAGAYTLKVTSEFGSTGIGLAEVYETDRTGRTANLSTRAVVRSGDGVLIGGFVIQGSAYKRMLIRGIGPTLEAFGLTDTLADPVVTVYAGQKALGSNDDWSAGPNPTQISAAAQAVGAFALRSGSKDSALLVTLPPGAYTVEVAGKAGAQGVAILEIYEVP